MMVMTYDPYSTTELTGPGCLDPGESDHILLL